jgi:hypothetical protein
MDVRRATIADAPALAEFNVKMGLETEAIEAIPEVITACLHRNNTSTIVKLPQRGAGNS